MIGRRTFSAALIAAAASLAGCGSDDDVVPPAPASTQAQLRAVHASADTPQVDVYINGTSALQNVAFGSASAFASVSPGATRVQVTLAGQPASTAPIDVSVPLVAGRDYSAIAIGSGSTGATRLQAVLVDDDGSAPAAGQVKLRVVHGAPAVPAVDIFVTAPGAALPTAPTIAALSFGQQAPASTAAALSVPAGSYQIRARVAGQTAIAYDSGTVALAAGSDIVLVAVAETVTSLSPIQLLLAPKGGAAALAKDARAALRVAHFSPDVPAVDVFLKAPGAANDVSNRALAGVTFPTDSGFLNVAAGTYDASVSLAGSLAGVINLNGASLAPGTSTSVFAIGLLSGAGNQALRLAAYPDNRSAVAGKAKVRVIHLSPDAPAVDVVVLSGGSIAARPVTNITFPNATAAALELDPGTYTLAVVPTGAATPILPTAAGVTVTLAAGDVKTIVAIGALAAAGAQPFQLKVLDDN